MVMSSSDTDRKTFLAWFEQTYGRTHAYATDPSYFQIWLNMGKPTATATAPPTVTTTTQAQTLDDYLKSLGITGGDTTRSITNQEYVTDQRTGITSLRTTYSDGTSELQPLSTGYMPDSASPLKGNPQQIPSTPPPEGYRWEWDNSIGDWVAQPAPAGQGTKPTPYQQQQTELDKQKQAWLQQYQQQQLAQQQAEAQWQQQYQQQGLAWQQQQFAQQQEADKQNRLAQLKANPGSWLEYAALAKQQPVVQPWMLPLMPEQYLSKVTTGSPIPGWGGESAAGMPQLTTPSTQYMARIAPSAKQQLYGYEQARTGATPQDVQWQLWNQAPPGGSSGGLNYSR